jgi:lipopolysaccharide transport system permease protein
LPVLILQTLFAFALGVIFSLFTPFFKDMKEAIPIFMQLWFWGTPIIYVKDILENKYPYLLTFNPFYHFVSIYQNIFLYSKAPSWSEIVTILFLTFSLLFIAVFLYKKMVPAIKDII